ncbi:TRAP transporter small permease [Marinobacterium sp. YM272]|uniref:TRAP transporter small permease n=1 Tax=Marinobacterium sp. YM272 TaxID=3421654 RepID=UPI003D7FF021
MQFTQWLYQHYPEKGPMAWLAFLLEALAGAIMLALVLLTCFDVAGRYFFGNALDGSTEMTEIALAIIVFAEIPVITWRGTHVVIDLLDGVFGRWVKVLETLSALLISAMLYVLGDTVMTQAERSLRREVTTEYLHVPVGDIMQYIGFMCWLSAACTLGWGIYYIFIRRKQTA